MAKSKSFFGLRTGSTKTLTFQVLNGKQITKDRVEIVKNPRTQSQMAQRCLMATASAAYSAMRKIVNHSFQGYSYGQQNMSKFISENVFLLQNAVEIGATDYGYNPFRDRSFKPGAYMISRGTLTPTVYTIDAVCETPRIRLTLMDGLLPSNYTANDIAEMMGLSLGEMSTICMIFGSDEAGWNFGFLRIRFIKAGDEPLNDELVFTQHFELESNIATPDVVLGADYLGFTIYEENIRESWNVYFGAIYSRKSANGWLRSTSYITVPDGTELQPDYETALATYPQGTGYILNGAIIPNGGRVEPGPAHVTVNTTPALPITTVAGQTISLEKSDGGNWSEELVAKLIFTINDTKVRASEGSAIMWRLNTSSVLEYSRGQTGKTISIRQTGGNFVISAVEFSE